MKMNELPEQIFKIYRNATNQVLTCIEAAVPPSQFRALRKLVLDSFGRSGAEGRVLELFQGVARKGPGGEELNYARKDMSMSEER